MKKDTRDLIKLGAIVGAGLITWNWISGKGGIISPAAVVGGVITEAVETVGSTLWNIPPAIARGVHAEEIGQFVFEAMTSESEIEEYFAQVQWGTAEQTGIPTKVPSIGILPFLPSLLPKTISHPEVVTLGPTTKAFIEEAPWREDPTAFAGLPGPTIGGVTYPSVEAYLEAQRAKYVKAGCID